MVVHQPNTEPLPGYRLLEPLGRGGCGEVWKCEAPGGLVKAIKFVSGTSHELNGADQELRALEHIKSIRHPFLLSMERVEVVDGDLLIVMELADRSLEDLLADYRAKGQAGIPRNELLGYLREAAEVLDLMNQQHNLQHLDIKPSNLFLVAGHVKVADFGLVNSLAELDGNEPAPVQLGAVTPVYAAPENFEGTISACSDQYSLAVTYQELLTGQVPFNGKSFRQLALQHMQAIPDLSALPDSDRPSIARALAKDPKDRFPSCSAFMQALAVGMTGLSEMRVPARTYFALESDPKPPKLPTAHDSGGLANSTARVRAVKLQALPTPAPAPAPAEFAGLRLLECLSRQPGGELWRSLTPDGRKRFVRFVFDVDDACAQDDPFARLAQLKHERLAKMEIVRDGPNRVGLVIEAGDENLGVRLKECMQAGMPGIPRLELLEHLRGVAAAIDAIFEEHRVQHLTLSPRTVVLVGGKARLMDFGLAEFFWLPSGQSPGVLNTRYSAPELFASQITRHVDQYSLALIFQEMLTGVHAFRNLNARQLASPRQRGTPDLGMLPATDRVLVLRALNVDPDRRFPCCREFIEALVQATVRAKTPNSLPPSRQTPDRALEPAVNAPKVIAPSPRVRRVAAPSREIINELLALATEGREVRECAGIRFLLTRGVSIVHHCCVRLTPSMVRLKIAGFRERWKAELVESEGDQRFLFRVPTSVSLWRRALGLLPSLAVEIRCEFNKEEDVTLTEATIEIRPLNCNESQSADLLEDMGPRVLESVREYLLAAQERRSQMRLPFEQSVQVLPVFDGEPGEAILSKTRDVSQRGMSVLMPRRPPSAQVCVLLSLPSHSEPVSILARVLRVQPNKDGRFEIGLAFS
jgi:serine/threonine protein kinase